MSEPMDPEDWERLWSRASASLARRAAYSANVDIAVGDFPSAQTLDLLRKAALADQRAVDAIERIK